MNSFYLSPAQPACFANDNSAFIPEHWAQEGLAILEENMVMANLVHRDFENEIANYGDVVNTRKPGEFQIRRKRDGVSLSHQAASATNVRVPLDQWFYTSFVIRDGEASMSFQDLVLTYLRPGMQTIARSVDRALLGHVHAFVRTPAKRAGRLGALDATNSKDFLLEAREILNVNKAPVDGRNLVLAPSSETALLKNDMFIKANERGDGGTALESARLGRVLGFETFMAQNVNSAVGSDVTVGAVNNVGGYAAGTTGSMDVTITSHEVAVGEYVTIAGNDQPTFATARTTSSGDTTAVTLNEALKYAVANDAVIKVFEACAVKGNFAAGHSEAVVVDGWTAAPQVGQLIAFGTGTSRRVYTIIESWLSASGEQSLVLDRPLEIALSDNDPAFPGPAGALNLAFHRNALALVSRPLAVPSQALGAMSAVAAYNNVAMRATMQYDINAGGTIVNLDLLAGVAVLDEDLAVAFLG